MAGKTVNISMDSINAALNNFSKWIVNFFKTIDLYGIIALGIIVLGLVMFIVGFIVL